MSQDDGSPMVSCGSCARWQHIKCHDFADRKAGFPKRNWDVQQFVCQRCRAARMGRMNNGHGRSQPVDQYTWQQPPSQRLPVQPTHATNYLQPAPEPLFSQQPTFENRIAYGQEAQQQPYTRNAQPPTALYSCPQEITFSHYQPEQHGFSQNMDPSRWPSGYPSGSRNPATHQTIPFSEQAAYGNRIPPVYQVCIFPSWILL